MHPGLWPAGGHLLAGRAAAGRGGPVAVADPARAGDSRAGGPRRPGVGRVGGAHVEDRLPPPPAPAEIAALCAAIRAQRPRPWTVPVVATPRFKCAADAGRDFDPAVAGVRIPGKVQRRRVFLDGVGSLPKAGRSGGLRPGPNAPGGERSGRFPTSRLGRKRAMLAGRRQAGPDGDADDFQVIGVARLPNRPRSGTKSAYHKRCVVLRGVLVLRQSGFTTAELATVTGLSDRQVRNKLALLRGLADGTDPPNSDLQRLRLARAVPEDSLPLLSGCRACGGSAIVRVYEHHVTVWGKARLDALVVVCGVCDANPYDGTDLLHHAAKPCDAERPTRVVTAKGPPPPIPIKIVRAPTTTASRVAWSGNLDVPIHLPCNPPIDSVPPGHAKPISHES